MYQPCLLRGDRTRDEKSVPIEIVLCSGVMGMRAVAGLVWTLRRTLNRLTSLDTMLKRQASQDEAAILEVFIASEDTSVLGSSAPMIAEGCFSV
jgi:hypothetical protein